MERPKIFVTKEARGVGSIFNLALGGGTDPGSVVKKEFGEVADKHSLCPEGGCYEANALTSDPATPHATVTFLGGMYVQPAKLDEVLADLKARGYEIVNKLAA